LNEAKKEGLKIRLTGVPTLIIKDEYKIVAAQPLSIFTGLLDKITKTHG
jgi:predicted DsbA family dithiol-disulfide isomerase